MAIAAYAVGTVIAVRLAQHLPQRRMLILYVVLLLIGSILTAAAQNAGMLIAGHVLQGLCTSLLLIAAPAFLAQTGWTLDSRMTGPELAERYLTDTALPASLSPLAVAPG
jgi:MFS family permease